MLNANRWFVILLLVLLTPYILSGSGNKKNYVVPNSNLPPEGSVYWQSEEADTSGVFFCSVKSRDDVFQGNMFRTEVKVHPASGNWPGLSFDRTNNVNSEMTATVWVKIRGVDCPAMHESGEPDWVPHHDKLARHRRRHTESALWAWNTLSGIKIKWLTNPERLEGDPYVLCDMFLEIGGMTVSFADYIVEEDKGLAIANHDQRYDWGRDYPRLFDTNR